MKNAYILIAAGAISGVLALCAAPAQAQLTVQSERINTLVGEVLDSPNVPVSRRHVLGTDLGLTAMWRGYGIVLFGDSLPSLQSPPAANIADAQHDDAWAFWLMAASDRNATPPSFTMWTGPTIRVVNRTQNDLNMGGARTPAGIASFNESFWWGLFARVGAHKVCRTSADCQGLFCDTDLRVATPLVGNPVACLFANRACADMTVGQTGVCRDASTTNPMRNYSATDLPYLDAIGRPPLGVGYLTSEIEQRKLLTVATVHEFGPNTGNNLSSYSTVPWITSKFTNVTMRTTRDFTDYRLPPADPIIDNMLWIWGRPSYWTNTTRNAPAEVFLAAQYRSKLPKIGDAATQLNLMYRKADGTWSTNQNDAAKLTATDGWADGVVGHMTVTYLEGPKKWLMTYGGGIPTSFDAVGGPLPNSLSAATKTDGTIKMRLADHPWGPWSAPVEALSPFDDDPSDDGDDGICHHLHNGGLFPGDRCGGSSLARSQFFQISGPGSIYGASVVEGWSTWSAATRNAQIGWFVSTWNPYEVHQMKSTIHIP